MAIFRTPVYLMILVNDSYSATPQAPYAIRAGLKKMTPDSKTVLQLKFDLEIDDELLNGVLDTNATIVVDSFSPDPQKVVAGLKDLVKGGKA